MANTVNVPNPAGQTTTKLENAESGFKASETLAANLQKVLVDFIALELVGKHAHWNIVGPNFRDLHLNLDEVVEIAREGADEIAERMRALHASPDGRPAVVAASTTGTMREVHDQVDEEDPTSADILHGLIQQLEQQAWFISAETRTPTAH